MRFSKYFPLATVFIPAITTLPQLTPSASANTPVPAIQWQACPGYLPDGFDCATVPAPLDYANPAAGTISLAVVRHAATDQAHRIGSLFFNPGGPSGSGVLDMPAWFALFPAAAQARFDIVSWDPRGTNQSTAMKCFPTPDVETSFFGNVPINAFPVGVAEQTAWFEKFDKFAQICQQQNKSLLSHVSTTDTARDMDLLRQGVGDQTLSYLGISYGTYLGAVYANLFPDRVRALILDGNVDPETWTNNGQPHVLLSDGVRLGSSASSVESVNAFLDQCGLAGPGKCAFSTGEAEGTHAKWETLLKRLKTTPATLQGYTFTYALTVESLHNWMFTTLAEPNFPGWAKAAVALQSLWDPGTAPPATPAPPPATDQPPTPASAYQASAVQCAESPNPRPPEVYRALNHLVHATYGQSGLPDLWNDEPCASWLATAADKYEGPWNHPTPVTVLVIGNTNDPSTPYQNSVAMAQELAQARLLTVQGYGHTVLLNPSSCASQYESDYLISGTLPAAGTVCQQDALPFQ